MSRKIKLDPRIARERRDRAISRGELRTKSSLRVPSAGVTSFAVKAEDPETRAMIDAFLSHRGQFERVEV